MTPNRQFTLMAQAAGEKLLQRNPEQLAQATGFQWDGKQLTTESLGIPISIAWTDWSITPKLDSWHELTILQYLANTSGTTPTGRFLSMSNFRSGGFARGASFDRENDRIIARIGKHSEQAIQRAAHALAGVALKDKSDLTFLFSFLPHVPIKLHLWLADEDFPASGKVLFDSSAETDLQVEAAGTAAGILLTLLENKLTLHGLS